MQIIRHKKLYLPAYSIIVVVLLLIFLISLSTYRTLNHQKNTALLFLKSQGVTLLHALEAGAQTGMSMPMWTDDSVNTLIQEIGKNSNITYIYIYDEQGVVIHDSNVPEMGILSIWRPELDNKDHLQARLKTLDDGSQVYELAKRFTPHSLVASTKPQSGAAQGSVRPFSDHHAGNIIVLGMSMDEIEAAHRSDIQHAMVMAATLLLLGSAALFFAFVIQNYYLVDKALKQSRDYLRQVLDSMANGILSIDEKGKITSYNKPALNMLGLKDEVVKHTDLDSIINFHSSGIDETLTAGTTIMEKEIIHSRLSVNVPVALSVSPVIDENGSRTGAVIILRDLTEIKRLQEKLRRAERLAAIGELAAGVAHEVRNPLSSIRGFAQFLGHVLRDKPQEREYAEIMVKEVDRINGVVTNLLSFARPAKPEPSPTDISRLIVHTVRLVEEDARMRNVSIRVSASHGMDKFNVDGDQITQVMLNLILNALQAVEPGGYVEIEALVEDSKTLSLRVEDDGPGVPPENVGRIFDPFFSTKEKGSGLGLAIVHMIVEYHKGEISIASPVTGKSKGTRITIHLPIESDAAGNT